MRRELKTRPWCGPREKCNEVVGVVLPAGAATTTAAATATVPTAPAATTEAAAAAATATATEAATAAAAACRTGLARACLVDDDLATLEVVAVERGDGRVPLGVIGHLDEAEALRASRLAIEDHGGSLDLAVL